MSFLHATDTLTPTEVDKPEVKCRIVFSALNGFRFQLRFAEMKTSFSANRSANVDKVTKNRAIADSPKRNMDFTAESN